MINIAEEEVFPLAAVPRFLPVRRKGRKANVATVYRWAQRGIKGVRLEVLQVGGSKCTSLPALQRFFERLGAQATGQPIEAQPSKQREREIREAEHALDEAGIS